MFICMRQVIIFIPCGREDNVVRSRIVYRVPSNWINFVVNNKFDSRATRTSFPCENRSIHILIWRRDIF